MTGQSQPQEKSVSPQGEKPGGSAEVHPPDREARQKAPPAVRRESAACDALRTYVRDLYFSQFGSSLPATRELVLQLRAVASPADEWGFRFEPPLSEQVSEQLQEWQAARAVYREGHVYCFRCESSACEHSVPPNALSVFAGYAPNGVPEWTEFAQVLIDRADSRVDTLYQPKPGVVSMVQLGSDLKKRQLTSFGRSSRSYAVLGQVAAGYFNDNVTGERAEKVAVTLQAVETRDEEGRMELRLNTIVRMPGDMTATDRMAEGWQPALARACAVAQKQMTDLQQSVRAAQAVQDRAAAKKALSRIPAILRLLSDSIERGYRQQIRRTHHANERRTERPVHKALDDVREAGPECFFVDEKAGTFAIRGSHGRIHIFAGNGRHVTSMRLEPSAIDFRLRTRRWRTASPNEVEQIREQIAAFVPRNKSDASSS